LKAISREKSVKKESFMARMTKRPAKKNVSPVLATVIIVVVLALVAVIYMKFSKDKQGMDMNTPEMREVKEQVNQFVGSIDPAKVAAWRAKRLKEGPIKRMRRHPPLHPK
jgi:uncharacterized membrane protein (DUF106 family)